MINMIMPDNSRVTRSDCSGRSGRSGWYGLVVLMLFLGVFLFPHVSVEAKDRFKLFDITFPQAKKGESARLADIVVRGRKRSPKVFTSTDVTFFINKKGRVDSLDWGYAASDSLVFEPYADSLLSAKFEAGKVGGQKGEFSLVGRFIVLSDKLSGHDVLELPVGEKGKLIDYSLALKSMEKYGYKASSLLEFPSYFYKKPSVEDNRNRMCEFAVIHVNLDSVGSVVDRSVYYATDESLAEMIQTAISWADFAPAEFAGAPVGSEGYVFVRFFREVSYPVGIWRLADSDNEFSSIDQIRVSWVAGSEFGGVAPVQRSKADLGVLVLHSNPQEFVIDAQLRVSANGLAGVTSLSGVVDRVDHQLTLDKLKSIPYYPAFRVVADSVTEELGVSYYNSLGKLKLIPMDSNYYYLETEFVERFGSPEPSRSSSR